MGPGVSFVSGSLQPYVVFGLSVLSLYLKLEGAHDAYAVEQDGVTEIDACVRALTGVAPHIQLLWKQWHAIAGCWRQHSGQRLQHCCLLDTSSCTLAFKQCVLACIGIPVADSLGTQLVDLLCWLVVHCLY